MKNKIWYVLLISGLMLSAKAQTVEDGIKALDYENYRTAQRTLSKLTREQPTNANAFYYLGIAYCNLGKIDSARLAFTAGTVADPKAINNHIGIGRTYLEENNVQKATEYFEKARSLTNQKDVNYYLYTADAYSSARHPNYDQAIQLLNKAIELNNKNPEVYWVLGKTYDAMINKGGDAVSAYERATDLNPTYAKAFTRIGAIWVLNHNGNLAEESFQKAIKADPNFPPAYREQAEFFNTIGRVEQAVTTFQKYLSMADQDEYTRFRYAVFLFKAKKYNESLNELNQLKTKIDTPVMYRLLGYTNYETGHYPEGMTEMLTFFKKQDPTKILPSDYEYLGKLYMKSGQDSLAAINLEKAALMDSMKYALYDSIANMYYKKALYKDAAHWDAEKIAHLPKTAPYKDVVASYFTEGKTYALAKDYVVSDSVFKKLTEIAPTWPIGYFWRARINTNLDSQNPDSVKGLAAPYYHLVIEKVDTSVYKYRVELFEAYQYLGNINALRENYGAAMYYIEKALTLKPDVAELKSVMESLKENYKQPGSGSIPCTKGESGYMIPAIVNGKEISLLYDAGLTGIAMTQEGSAQIFGEAGKGKIDLLKIGERSLKNIPVTVVDSLKNPVVIGADVINKMNMVFDYASSSLIVR